MIFPIVRSEHRYNHRGSGDGVQFVFTLLGMATAYVLPKVVVEADEEGQWQSIHFDWSAKLLDVHRR